MALRPLAWGCVFLSFIGLDSDAGWIFELACHFRVQYLVVEILFLTALVVETFTSVRRNGSRHPLNPYRHLFIAELTFLIIAIGANLSLVADLLLPGSTQPKAHQAGKFRLMQINVNASNREYARVVDCVRRYDPLVISFEEVSEPWRLELERRLPDYPYRLVKVRPDNFGIALFSKLPLENGRLVVFSPEAGTPSAVATVRIGTHPLTIVAMHPLPPAFLGQEILRNKEFDAFARCRHQLGRSLVLQGDLNSTSWSAAFNRLCRSAGLVDTRVARGIQPTWPSIAPVLHIPIDHFLVSPDISVLDRFVCDYVGSDHLPVVMDAQVTGRTALSAEESAGGSATQARRAGEDLWPVN